MSMHHCTTLTPHCQPHSSPLHHSHALQSERAVASLRQPCLISLRARPGLATSLTPATNTTNTTARQLQPPHQHTLGGPAILQNRSRCPPPYPLRLYHLSPPPHISHYPHTHPVMRPCCTDNGHRLQITQPADYNAAASRPHPSASQRLDPLPQPALTLSPVHTPLP